MAHEIEVKIRVEDPAAVIDRLEKAGAERVRPRTFEDNRLFDRDGGALAREGRMLRIRREGDRTILTAKAPAGGTEGDYKVRHEVETEIPDAARLAELLEAVGFETVWRYQKYRTTWRLEGAVVTLDEIPHACFLEIEADRDAIDAVACRLGFERRDYVRSTYRDVHEEWCAAHGVAVGDMVFEEVP